MHVGAFIWRILMSTHAREGIEARLRGLTHAVFRFAFTSSAFAPRFAAFIFTFAQTFNASWTVANPMVCGTAVEASARPKIVFASSLVAGAFVLARLARALTGLGQCSHRLAFAKSLCCFPVALQIFIQFITEEPVINFLFI